MRPKAWVVMNAGGKVPMAEAIVLLIILVALWGVTRVKPRGPEV